MSLRRTFMVTVDTDTGWQYGELALEQIISAGLKKEKNGPSGFVVRARKVGPVEEAALHFAEQIRESASDAASARIR